jgi:hypothetical protein
MIYYITQQSQGATVDFEQDGKSLIEPGYFGSSKENIIINKKKLKIIIQKKIKV